MVKINNPILIKDKTFEMIIDLELTYQHVYKHIDSYPKILGVTHIFSP